MALLTAPFPTQDTSFVSQIFQASQAARQRQAEQAQNYALQIAEETRRAQEAAQQRDFDRNRHDELIREFNVNNAFNTGKDIREAKLDALKSQNYALDIAKKTYDQGTGGSGITPTTEPPLPSDPSVGGMAPDPSAAPVDLPPLPDASGAPAAASLASVPSASSQITTAPATGSPSFIGPITPAQQIDPVVRPPVTSPGDTVPGAVVPQIVGSPPPDASAAAPNLGFPGPGYTPAAKPPASAAAAIANLDQSLRTMGIRNDTREKAVSEAATKLILGEQKLDSTGAGANQTVEEAATARGFVKTDAGWLEPTSKTLMQPKVAAGGKVAFSPAKPTDAGLTPIPGHQGLFTGPGQKGVFKDDGKGSVVKVGTDAKLNTVLQAKDGSPILAMNDGTFLDQNGNQIQPPEVQKIVGALDKPKVDAAAAKDSREKMAGDRQFFANEAKRARDEAQKLRTMDLAEKPKEPYAEGGKYYKGASKAIEIDKPTFDKLKAGFDDYQKKINDADTRGSQFEQKVSEIQSQIDALGTPDAGPAPAADTPAPGGPPPAPAAVGKTKYVFKGGKLVPQ